MLAKNYAPHLRKLALKLKHRAIPRGVTKQLEFSETQVAAQGDFPFQLVVTIKTDATITQGYIVAEFNERFASAGTDFVGGKLIFGNDDVLDNQELTEYLASLSKQNIAYYALAIGKTPFISGRPFHIVASGKTAFHVGKVLYFDQ
jgi:hypothetical protein